MLCKSCAGMSDPNIWWMKCDECLSTGRELLTDIIKRTQSTNDLAIKKAVEVVEAQFRRHNGHKINLSEIKSYKGRSA